MEYLGHVISCEGVGTDLKKIATMVEWPRPTTVRALSYRHMQTFWSELFKSLGAGLHMSIAYHPDTYEQTKRVSQCVEAYLRCICFLKLKSA